MPGATADNTRIAKRTSPTLVLALLTAGVLAGCGGSKQAETIAPATVSVSAGTTRSTQAAPRLHRFARAYLRIVAPANAAHARLVEKSRSYGSNTTKAEVVADLVPVVAAYEVADKALLRAHWPPAVEADVRALVAADESCSAIFVPPTSRPPSRVAPGPHESLGTVRSRTRPPMPFAPHSDCHPAIDQRR